MGILRFLLAIAVIFGHSGSPHGISFVGGQIAVEAFFIISGFYIALILNEKYIKQNNSYKLFITNRLLRLYPYYWIISIATLICAYFIPHYNSNSYMGNLNGWRTYGNDLNIISYSGLLFTNLFLFCQDVVMFLGVNIKNGNLFFTPKFYLTNPPLYTFLLVPQAWSIGIELAFYLIAPFIVRKRYTIIIILLLASMIGKIYAMTHGLNSAPWSYQFFPFELMYFMMGTLSYFIYKKFIENIKLPKYIYQFVYIGLSLFTMIFSFIHIRNFDVVYIVCLFLSIPFLFKYTEKFKLDRYIGELSYPIYISHILVLNICRAIGPQKYSNIETIIGATVLSMILVKFVGGPIERIRQGRIKNQKGVIKWQLHQQL
ncbi:MAG: hypothetical protein JWQ57_86 [Mucilaginibacter sp.]|nr:hypothetical protein [Mucilaginibacter sp.]